MFEATDLRLKCYQDALAEMTREELHVLITFQHIMLTEVIDSMGLEEIGLAVPEDSKHTELLEKGRIAQDRMVEVAEVLYNQRIGRN